MKCLLEKKQKKFCYFEEWWWLTYVQNWIIFFWKDKNQFKRFDDAIVDKLIQRIEIWDDLVLWTDVYTEAHWKVLKNKIYVSFVDG